MNKKNTDKAKKKGGFREYISGNVLANEGFIRRLPVLAFVGMLILLYMANGFSVQKKHNRIDELIEEIKELQTVSVTTSAVRVESTRQQRIEEMLRERNIPLNHNTTSPKVIRRTLPAVNKTDHGK